MSRGGGGGRGFGGGRGRGRGRGFPGGSNMPPMGLSFEDLATLSREPTALYPSMGPLPVLSVLSSTDKQDIRHQIDFENKMRASPYYIVEPKRSTGLLQVDLRVCGVLSLSGRSGTIFGQISSDGGCATHIKAKGT